MDALPDSLADFRTSVQQQYREKCQQYQLNNFQNQTLLRSKQKTSFYQLCRNSRHIKTFTAETIEGIAKKG
jgi:hypothetical protein